MCPGTLRQGAPGPYGRGALWNAAFHKRVERGDHRIPQLPLLIGLWFSPSPGGTPDEIQGGTDESVGPHRVISLRGDDYPIASSRCQPAEIRVAITTVPVRPKHLDRKDAKETGPAI